ncbi:MAG TPA: phosphoribosylformylglycinamidine cyclo-ligase [Stellaceae bacterium]|jgi:phosphoribosylformylglycinamidine cyclo-ligase|nr:phosphoribosylformylglycinamidine cyclo-ligase [Stellaceae bacterium]
MTASHLGPEGYRTAGVDIGEADAGLRNIVGRITATWPKTGLGAVQLPIGYFANIIDIGGGIGLGLCTDGVGSKAMLADMMGKYDTIGIDCVAMNVNDLLCVGARPLSMVDYIAVERADAAMLDGIAIGLAEGARQAGISISGGEISQLRDIVRGFDLVGSAVGTVPLDRIIVGRDAKPGDQVIGIASNGIHSNGFTLARRAFFDRAGVTAHHVFPQLGCKLGEELLRPTFIYVPEILEIIERIASVKALVHITGDGLLNLPRVDSEVGFVIDKLPPAPPIFDLIEEYAEVGHAEMFEVYNMGIGFCVVVAAADVEATLAVLARHRRQASVIGHVVADSTKSVHLPQHGLVGRGKNFGAL